MTEDAVKILRSEDPAKRVVIVQRNDGYYSIRPERWATFDHETEHPPQWVPMYSRVEHILAGIEIAEREACAQYPWAQPDDPNSE